MLHGENLTLRPRTEADVAVLHAEIYEDLTVRPLADTRPWTPRLPGDSPFAVPTGIDDAVFFSIADDTGELAGACELWGIDAHQRSAHIGIALRPAWRGRGLASDTVAVLCHYAFDTRGLHRVGLETLTSNTPMIAAATRNGFTEEGRLRQAQWAHGTWHDRVLFGLLRGEWGAVGA
ncbi:GNAT family N-acetyltransferase [Phytomonospora endophytica]|uniref:RimJ/RimL family protein N-acetyltransferase n=1 Tax=Phytomonospora endophytica TaxID=714109 RepID=A0A841FR72_9ACTN|nr:GNAT family protein [Phytomonospora endophytica]MBB6037323.1 RimJ/RimL family protein N-acetyltransferase [Phytomonospora endophytica]GIG69933.1 GNAT family N-acetyltransferase [Phytomonospora endophytica]